MSQVSSVLVSNVARMAQQPVRFTYERTAGDVQCPELPAILALRQ